METKAAVLFISGQSNTPDDAHYLPKVQQWFAETFYHYVRDTFDFQ